MMLAHEEEEIRRCGKSTISTPSNETVFELYKDAHYYHSC